MAPDKVWITETRSRTKIGSTKGTKIYAAAGAFAVFALRVFASLRVFVILTPRPAEDARS